MRINVQNEKHFTLWRPRDGNHVYGRLCMRGATIRIKDRGSDVAELQAKLGVTADGRFGPNGARSRRIPGGACLTTDGVVGPKTWKALGVE